MAEPNFNIKQIDLLDLLDILKKHIIMIIIAAVVAASGSYVWTKMNYIPAYKSTATLYMLRQYDTNGQQLTTGMLGTELSLSAVLIGDCTYILKMPAVLNEVISELRLNTTAGALKGCISTNNPQNTRVLEVSVVAATPELAKEIVDVLCELGAEKIVQTIGVNQVNISEYGNIDTTPCNLPKMSKHLIIGAAAAVIVFLVYLAIFLLDDGIKSDEDVERYLGLSVLGKIPDTDAPHSRRYGYYGYGYGYGNNKRSGKHKKASDAKISEESEG